MSPIGTVVPEVLVSPTISTVIQFRTIDWGMEDPRPHVSIPAPIGAVKRETSAWCFTSSSKRTRLAPPRSFQSRPPRFAKIEDIESTRSRRFACKSDDVLSFELACSGIPGEGECSVEWWQKQGSDPVVYLTQHPTV
ncbi:hypothetical protein DFH08DRAFT_696414 [Mycena albidolilacea]|uniref:Uncharacterized protein n=1 Tax=Mycena albidolilacea TaxID=1033008 RepID=A0AAD7A5U1_9AGAR|nr:hypothetical protein DFH08DRAFT_696414 [Mycena albidolilacea]